MENDKKLKSTVKSNDWKLFAIELRIKSREYYYSEVIF